MSAVTCADLHPFLDGELADERARAFRRHLATCGRCPVELREAIMLDELAGPLLGPARGPRTVEVMGAPSALAEEVARQDDLADRRSHRRAVGFAIAGALAAAVVMVFLLGRNPGSELVALQVMPHRSIEGRLSYPGMDGHRPFRRVRDGSSKQWQSAREQVLAGLEQRGDEHGLGVALMVEGQFAPAAEHLDRALATAPSAATLSDRAALAIEQGDGVQALALADRALGLEPAHPPALWNRAVALELLGRKTESLHAYEGLAQAGEAGWSGEAQRRAQALRLGGH